MGGRGTVFVSADRLLLPSSTSASTAANKAFIVNRIGDAMFIMGMFLMVWYFGSLRFNDVFFIGSVG